MATISSTSTEAEITAAFLDNAGYEEDDSATMAAAFITVCKAMLSRAATVWQHGDERMEFSPSALRELIKEARAFVRSKGGISAGGPGEVFADFRDFKR